MINRAIQPELKDIKTIDFVTPNNYVINDVTSMFVMDKVADETVRVELHFNAGQVFGKKNMSSFVSALLFSGTSDKKSAQIHEELDLLGAYIDHEISMESAFVHLYCLKSNIKAAIAILADALQHVNFDLQEIKDMLQEKKQRYLISIEKVSFLARKEFQKYFFANFGNYSRQLEVADFDHVEQSDLLEFHNSYYLKGLRKIVVVGNLNQEELSCILEHTASWAADEQQVFGKEFKPQVGQYHVEKKGALQTAIRLGIPVFNKKHTDYIAFQVLQTILGDYFGSRLMSNIREDKGYTYGIGCAMVELKETGYFVIATEVAKEVMEPTLKEIKFEIERLKTELIPEEELSLVKNYLLGQLLKSADGPNAMMDLFIGVQQHQLGLNFYDLYIQTIHSITAEELMSMANKYFIWDKFTLVTAG